MSDLGDWKPGDWNPGIITTGDPITITPKQRREITVGYRDGATAIDLSIETDNPALTLPNAIAVVLDAAIRTTITDAQEADIE